MQRSLLPTNASLPARAAHRRRRGPPPAFASAPLPPPPGRAAPAGVSPPPPPPLGRRVALLAAAALAAGPVLAPAPAAAYARGSVFATALQREEEGARARPRARPRAAAAEGPRWPRLASLPPPPPPRRAHSPPPRARPLPRADLLRREQALESQLRALAEAAEAEVASAPRGGGAAGALCARPFGVDFVGITETVALVGATVGGLAARQRKRELEEVNEKLRAINISLRRQARAGVTYAPGLNYAPSAGGREAAAAAVAATEAAAAAAAAPAAASEARASLREGRQALKDSQARACGGWGNGRAAGRFRSSPFQPSSLPSSPRPPPPQRSPRARWFTSARP